MAADGSFTIDAKLQTKDFTVSSRQLMTAVKNLEQSAKRTSAGMAKSASGYGAAMRTNARAAREFNAELKRLESEAANLKAKLNEKGNRMIATDDFKQLIKDQQKAQTEYDKLIDKKNKMKIAGIAHDSKDMDKLYYDLAKVESKMDELRMKREEMLSSGKAYVGGKETAEYAELEMKYNAISDRIQDMCEASLEAGSGFQIMARNAGIAAASLIRMVGGAALSFLRKLAAGARNAAIQLMRLAGNAIRTGIQKIGQLAGGAAKKLLGLGKSAQKSNGGFKVGLMTILKYGLGIRSLYFLFRRLRQAITDGFDAIAQKDTQVKSALNSLKTALSGLKGSLATAFAPILTAIAPALTTLINLLTTAINTVGAFFAALTGKSYFTKSVGALKATGNAAKGASGKVKELKNQLAGFDDLEILKANDSSGGGGGGGGGGGSGLAYETVPIDSGIAEFAKQLKDAWNNADFEGVGQIIAGKINGVFEKVKNLISWDNVGEKITSAINAIKGIVMGLIGPNGINFGLIGETFGEGVNTIVNTLTQLYDPVIFRELARKVTIALNSFITNVNWAGVGSFLSRKAESIVEALKTAVTEFEWGDTGRKFAQAVNSFFKNKNLWIGIGTTINGAIRGFLNFGKRFLEEFDEKQVAEDIKAALGKIKWRDIINDLWENFKLAVSKFGNFLTILFSDGPEIQNDTLALRSRTYTNKQNGKTTGYDLSAAGIAKTLSRALVLAFGKLKELLGSLSWEDWGLSAHDFLVNVEWKEIGTQIGGAIWEALSGIDDFLAAAIWGENYHENKMWQLLHPTEAAKWRLEHRTPAEIERDEQIKNYAVDRLSPFLNPDPHWQYLGGVGTAANILLNGVDSVISEYVDEERENYEIFNPAIKAVVDGYNRDKNGGISSTAELISTAKKFFSQNPTATFDDFTKAFNLSEKSIKTLKPIFAKYGDAMSDNTKQLKVENERLDNKPMSPININDPYAWVEGVDFDWGNPEVDVKTNLKPGTGGIGGTFYNVAQWVQKTFAGGSNSPIRTDLTPGKGGQGTTMLGKGIQWLASIFNPGVSTTVTTNLESGKGGNGKPMKNNGLSWLADIFKPGVDTNARIELIKKGWKTLGGFVGIGTILTALLGLKKSGWKTATGFIGIVNTLFAVLGLKKYKWETVPKWLGIISTIFAKIGLTSLFGSFLKWLTGNKNGDVTVKVSATGGIIGNVSRAVKDAWDSYKKKWNKLAPSWAKLASGGSISPSGVIKRFAAGGAISNSGRAKWWGGIPAYASGTRRAHGTMFVAGEAGPEVVGHIGGRTEVLNKSQLAQTMYSAVTAGMISVLNGLQFRMPAMASGTVLPYEIMAQQQKMSMELQNTLDANNEDLIQTIISVVGQQTTAIVAALAKLQGNNGGRTGMSAQEIINEINRRTQMFSASPLKGV